MRPMIGLVTILTDDVPAMVAFYRDTLGLALQGEATDNYNEFVTEGVRFAVCARAVMTEATQHPSFRETRRGQSFELAFPCESPEDVDARYAAMVGKGATAIQPPATMPWGMRAAFFADPDGNIHELYFYADE